MYFYSKFLQNFDFFKKSFKFHFKLILLAYLNQKIYLE